MRRGYEVFCVADPLFYDLPGNAPSVQDFVIGRRPAPEGWIRHVIGDWVGYAPARSRLPGQGWKIHVSGCLDNAERLLTAVWDYCLPRRIAFKFLRGSHALFMRNAKYAFRGGSGKLVTIYPADEFEAEVICKDLDEALAGEPGPYILSDLRYGEGPLYLRYGGFARVNCVGSGGQEVPAILDASGELVPDVRAPVFTVPDWVKLPEFLQPHLAARNAVTVTHLPYEITQALHYSNGGGVYLATDTRSGETVVLKEARPFAGLSADGRDAVTRLRRERDMLARLSGVDAVPRLLDYFTLGEHEFLVQEFIDGNPLNSLLVRRFPLVAGTTTVAEYAAWATRIHRRVSEAVAAVHRRGIVFGDLHMFNVIVRPDERIALIDFELAADVAAGERPGLGAAGFAAPNDRTGFDIDLYSLACLRLALFLPMTALFRLDPAKAVHFAEIIQDIYRVPRGDVDDAVRTITGGRRFDRAAPAWDDWPGLRQRMAAAILDSATPDRDDRLFPGDIAQFEHGGVNVAHGAAGVLLALDLTGVAVPEAHAQWLLARATRADLGTRQGFYDGLHGIAYVLDRLGHQQQALDTLELGLRPGWHELGDDLFGGLAGIGLNCAHFADLTGDSRLADAAAQATRLVAERLGTADSVAPISGGDRPHAGLMHGSAGRALLLLRMFERTGDTGLLDCARTALRQDLRRCTRTENGQLQVNEGRRTMPYLATGSAGIGLVIDRYLRHRADEEFIDAAEAIRRAASRPFYAQSGLFHGRAGIVLYRAGEPEAAAQIRRLSWHAMDPHGKGHLAFPGEQLFRLSMDLATGTAGVLLAVGAALHDRPVHLPFTQAPDQMGGR